jgi:hypothetical protein
MADEKLSSEASTNGEEKEYESPTIEEVVTLDGLEREAAYAGQPAPSRIVL